MRIPHPIPYQGSKRALASEILSFFPDTVETLWEPFAGSAAISLAVAITKKARKFHINDLNIPLIDLWKKIVYCPHEISSEYELLWKKQKDNPDDFYKKVREKFNQTKRSDYLLYLLARCAKASVRYNSDGEFNQSPDKRRLGTRPITMKNSVVYSSFLLKGKTKFTSLDYKNILQDIGANDLVYLDPPYQGVCGDRDNRYLAGIKIDEFISVLAELNAKNVYYIVSYDGRTGNKTHGQHLPRFLNLDRIELCAGRSTQATLLGRNDITYESLYLSPALKRYLCVRKERKQIRNLNMQLEFAETR